ncbi:hypothetical protein A249_21640, partial [Pseudomonas syringae pv. actinidiae ICMP 18804]
TLVGDGQVFQANGSAHGMATDQQMASHSNARMTKEHRTRFQAGWARTEPAIEALATEEVEGIFTRK